MPPTSSSTSPLTATDVENGDMIWQRFSVPFEFPVAFSAGLFDPANRLLIDTLALREPDKCHRCLVFIDEGVAKASPSLIANIQAYAAAHVDRMSLATAPVVIAGGERIKTELTHLESIQDLIHETRIDRHSYVIAIGGGAVLDAVGLAAATAHRGVRLIRLPTTVLSQNDSGVGVKNAVNLKGVKNYTGTFMPPWAVLNDYDFITRLPRRERISGIAEAVKVALIRDGAFFTWLEANADKLALFDPATEKHMIRHCARLHMRQIGTGGDPFEMGSARPLDYGHWSAHKLEAITRHHVNHGEAVAIGIALDARYSVLSGLLAEGEEERVVSLLEHLGFRIFHPGLKRKDQQGLSEIMKGLADFREHLGGDLTITLLSELGIGVEVHEIDDAKMAEAIDWLEAREGR